MKPIKKILVPVDFSNYSREALQWAADLSRRYEAVIELVHVVQITTYALPEGYVVPTPEQFGEITAELQKQLTAAEVELHHAGAFSVRSTLLQGGPTTEILRFAKEVGCDLIVMGTHGRSGLKHLVLGSVAENIVRSAECPVLTIRTQS